jgi:hypothetical protein
VELVTLKVVGRGFPDVPRAALAAKANLPANVLISQPLRQAYFGPVHGWRDTDVVNRADLDELAGGPASSRNTMQPAHPTRLGREPRPLWQYYYRCAGNDTLVRCKCM